MKNQDKNATSSPAESMEITRKEAIKKIGTYGKYAALTALGTYLILNPKTAQAQSPNPSNPGEGF